ncbi:MAG: sulfatase-like hydrolase/transferase [Akkermansia sp.]|nr:sulfatase-like hydrolase/transferase [Akkermansia sp.]
MKHPLLTLLLGAAVFVAQPARAFWDDILLDGGTTHKPTTPAEDKTFTEILEDGKKLASDIYHDITEICSNISGSIKTACSAVLLLADKDAPLLIKLERPKAILLFMADDLGYNDTSAYGCEQAPCPNVQRLADQGLLFTDAHSTNSVCTPSRYSLLTGQYAWRQKGTGILPGDAALILPTRDKAATLGTLMQQAGYRTAAIGKWHLGLGSGHIDWNQPISPAPADVGFDYSFIMAATGDRVPCVYVEDGKVRNLDPQDPIRVNYKGQTYPGEKTASTHPELLKPWGRPSNKQHADTIIDGISRIGHMTGGNSALWKDQDIADDITAAAESFITSCAGKPLFLYFCTNDIHVPRDPHARFRGKSSLGIRGDVTLQMDDSLGRLMTALQQAGYKPEESLIIFTSDNGPVISDGYEDGAREACAGHQPAHPWSGGKYTLLEGGTRVPFIVSWPGTIKPGISPALMCQMDIGRTLASLCGIHVPAGSMRDSENHLSALLGLSQQARSELVTQAFEAPRYALRSGQWKYIPSFRRQPERLFNLATDPAEKHNLVPSQPGKAAELHIRLRELTRESKH